MEKIEVILKLRAFFQILSSFIKKYFYSFKIIYFVFLLIWPHNALSIKYSYLISNLLKIKNIISQKTVSNEFLLLGSWMIEKELVFYSCIDKFIRMCITVLERVDQIFVCKHYKGKVIYSLDLWPENQFNFKYLLDSYLGLLQRDYSLWEY